MTTASVVGSGPNGLAAAVVLARAGLEVTVYEASEHIGGGTRTSDLTGHGALHDHCSAVHPFAMISAFAKEIDLGAAGLRWCRPEIDLAHPLDDGSAGVISRDLQTTAASLGADGRVWRAILRPLVDHLDDLASEIFRPVVHVPRHPVTLARFGMRAMLPASAVARLLTTPQAKALWGGIASHVMYPLDRPLTAAPGLTLAASAHAPGWVVAEGGSRSISDAMAKMLADAGGRIETGVTVRSLRDLPASEVTMLDLDPSGVVRIGGDALPAQVRQAYRGWKHGPAAFKLDLVVEGGVPWRNDAARRAGTVHVGGTWDEIAAGERQVFRGAMPERPFVLVGQQYLADPSRSAGDLHPVWTYAHVPNGYAGDATAAILAQLERFAPGLRDRIVGLATRSPAEAEAANANYVGGDILTGLNSPRQLLLRPRPGLDPYSTGIPGTWICSAATPPGAGAHGMCGYNAARRALAHLG